MRVIHVWPETKRLSPTLIHHTLVLEPHDGDRVLPRREIKFRIQGDDRLPEIDTLNHAAVMLVQVAMSRRAGLALHGPVCGDLLYNLEEFQAAWHLWLPEALARVDIRADQEAVMLPAPGPRRAVASFSGGVDAAFTVWRHHLRREERRHATLERLMLLNGFDVVLEHGAEVDAVEASARAMIDGLGLPLVTIRTNLREFLPDWKNSFCTMLAGGLHLIAGTAQTGLIAGDEPFSDFSLPWGSNPVTNPLLASGALRFSYDGADRTRLGKVEALTTWPAAVRHLRVCWYPRGGRNCGRCRKCVRTILNFKVLGIERPPCFDTDISDAQVAALEIAYPVQRVMLQEIHDSARARGITASWVDALAQALARPPAPA